MPSLLKSLELTGYKTFASKQRFEFSNAITAIVGPNGSGKSNIADAIRWVLGEQSYSLLRGRKTDDMIFSGSDKRSRSGMASATIVFDNTDGWLPIDFSEVSITRKAYRDGQNEYQINGSRVRLRDVNELLSQSGLSERTYTVIGQGLVDTALSLKADERRKLFEEAAGIGLYRSRKDQALKRLDNTKRNLERVWDILAELRPRLRSLERQAKRAEDYLQIQEDLKRTMREWYGYHWHKSQGDVQYTKTFAEKQERELATIKEKHQVLSTKLNTLRSRIQSNRINLNTWQQQLAEKHRQRENFSREIAVAKERIRSFESQIEQGQQEITRLEEEKKYRLEQYEQAEAVLNSMQKEHQEAEEQFSANKHKLDQINQERKELETRIEQLSQIIQDLKNQHALSSARIEEYQQRITEFDQQIIESNNEKESNARELSTLMEERTDLETNRSKLEQQGKTLMETLDDTRKKINQTREQIDLIKRSIDSYLAENARFKAEQDVLQDAENNLTGYASGTKVLLDPANRSRFSSLGSLNKLISIEPAYEKAISGLLQLFVDAVILENENATDQALDFLKKKV